jgi:hypothetical protein
MYTQNIPKSLGKNQLNQLPKKNCFLYIISPLIFKKRFSFNDEPISSALNLEGIIPTGACTN